MLARLVRLFVLCFKVEAVHSPWSFISYLKSPRSGRLNPTPSMSSIVVFNVRCRHRKYFLVIVLGPAGDKVRNSSGCDAWTCWNQVAQSVTEAEHG